MKNTTGRSNGLYQLKNGNLPKELLLYLVAVLKTAKSSTLATPPSTLLIFNQGV